MALGLPTDQRGQIMLLLVVAALGGGYGFWAYVHGPAAERIASVEAQIDTIDSIVAVAKAELAKGSKADIDRQIEFFRGALAVMRRLVPEENEVPTLIDDITNRSKSRGVEIGVIQPLTVDQGQPFDTYRYRLQVYGHYDEVGEFLTDVASLPRIVVPQDLTLRPATQQAQRILGDTVGGLLEVTFNIRTFVKAPPPPVLSTPIRPAGGTTPAPQ